MLSSAHETLAAVPAAPSKLAAGDLSMTLVSETEWHRAIADFDQVAQEQTASFASARGLYSALEPRLFTRNGEIVGGALICIRSLPLNAGKVAVSHWGPMLRRSDTSTAAADLADMLQATAHEYGRRRRMTLSLWRPPALPGTTEPVDLPPGFEEGSTWEHPRLYVLNLQQDPAAMRQNLHRKWRNHLNKSERAGLIFEVGREDQLPAFQRLYQDMLNRKGFSDATAVHTLPALLGTNQANLRPRLFFALLDQEVVAGAVVFTAGDRCCYLYGATSEAALSSNAGHFLQWNIALWLQQHTRARWYFLGGADGNEGLSTFKKGLAGSSGPAVFVPAVLTYAPTALARISFRALLAARDTRRRAQLAVEHWRLAWRKKQIR